MGLWNWEGVDREGKVLKGRMKGKTESEIRKNLRLKGIRARKVVPPSLLDFDIGEWLAEKGLGGGFKEQSLLAFTRQMSIMLDAGVVILQALDILKDQQSDRSFRYVVKQVRNDIAGGKTLADSLAQHKGFSKSYCSLIRAGETGGVLDVIFSKLTAQMEAQNKLKKKIKSAMTYPSIVIIIAIVLVYVMMTFVVPQFITIIEESGKEPPFITLFVMNMSEWFQEWGATLMLVLMGIFLFIRISVSTKEGKYVADQFLMGFPLIGNIVVRGNMAAFSRTLSTMLGAGIPMVSAMEICIETLDNSIISKDMERVRSALVEGKTFEMPLKKIGYLPPLMVEMIRIGEETGRTDIMLEKVSNILEEELSNFVDILIKLIEPIFLVGLGLIVGTILMAMFMPIISTGPI